jgi:hypothetical protein
LIKKLELDCIKLADLAKMPRGITVKSKLYHSEESDGLIQVLGGTNIQKFIIKDGNKRKPNRYLECENEKIVSKKLIFELPKRIVYQNIMSSVPKVVAALETKKRPTDDTLNNLVINNSKYLHEYILAILNSQIATFYLKYRIFNCATLTVHLDKPYLGELPIKNVELSTQKNISHLVNNLVDLKEKNSNTEKEENALSEILYKIYGLNEDDINMIENLS